MRNFLITLLIPILFINCSNDDDDRGGNETMSLNGKWSLINVAGGLLGIDQNFEKGTIVWDFNESDDTVTITNNNELQDVYTGPASGTYAYGIVAPSDAEVLVVNEISLGAIDLDEDSFTIEELNLDGVKYTFMRN